VVQEGGRVHDHVPLLIYTFYVIIGVAGVDIGYVRGVIMNFNFQTKNVLSKILFAIGKEKYKEFLKNEKLIFWAKNLFIIIFFIYKNYKK
ncbi:hypothetical protein ACR2XU_28245, partial [Klebsiella pneumoniae]